MQVVVDLDDRQMRQRLQQMQRTMPAEVDLIAETLAALGKEYARDLVTVMIYATPQRSGYRRTRWLIRSIYSAVERNMNNRTIIVGAAAHYAAFNEFGTYDGWLGSDAEKQILQDARAAHSDLIKLEYGDVASGLEPRPYIIPALVMLERKLPELTIRAIRRVMRG